MANQSESSFRQRVAAIVRKVAAAIAAGVTWAMQRLSLATRADPAAQQKKVKLSRQERKRKQKEIRRQLRGLPKAA